MLYTKNIVLWVKYTSKNKTKVSHRKETRFVLSRGNRQDEEKGMNIVKRYKLLIIR